MLVCPQRPSLLGHLAAHASEDALTRAPGPLSASTSSVSNAAPGSPARSHLRASRHRRPHRARGLRADPDPDSPAASRSGLSRAPGSRLPAPDLPQPRSRSHPRPWPTPPALPDPRVPRRSHAEGDGTCRLPFSPGRPSFSLAPANCAGALVRPRRPCPRLSKHLPREAAAGQARGTPTPGVPCSARGPTGAGHRPASNSRRAPRLPGAAEPRPAFLAAPPVPLGRVGADGSPSAPAAGPSARLTQSPSPPRGRPHRLGRDAEKVRPCPPLGSPRRSAGPRTHRRRDVTVSAARRSARGPGPA